MDGHRKTARQYLADIPTLESYYDLVEKVKLTDTERRLCDMKYLRGMSLIHIGEELGYSEIQMKRIHQKILRKLTRLI